MVTSVASLQLGRSWTYAYDGMDRLITADNLAGVNADDRSYAYDGADNTMNRYESGTLPFTNRTYESGTHPFVCDSALAFLLFPSVCKESAIPPKAILHPRRLHGMPLDAQHLPETCWGGLIWVDFWSIHILAE
jgi:hypothetical protein